MLRIRPTRLPLLVALAFFAASASAEAMMIDPGFETGALAPNWPSGGDATVVPNALGVLPTEGTEMALLTTITAANDPFGPLVADALDVSAFEGFFGIPGSIVSGQGNAGIEGSMMTQTFNANAGETLSFDWNLLTFETQAANNDDFVFFTIELVGSGTPTTGSPGGVLTPALAWSPTTNALIEQSGWQTYNFAITTSGSYRLGVGVFDAGNRTNPSAALIDNFQLVPEPGTGLLLWAGLALCLRGRTGRS